MKIISPPVDCAAWNYKIKCYFCQAGLEATMEDVVGRVYSPCFGGESYEVRCPVCKQELHIDKFAVPKIVQKELDPRTTTRELVIGGGR